MLRARTDRALVTAENEQIHSVCSPLITGAPIFCPVHLVKKDKPKLQNNWPSFLIPEIKYELVTFEILSLVMWRAVATCGGDISIIVRDIYTGGDWPVLDLAPSASWPMINVTMRVSWPWSLGINHDLIWFYVLLMWWVREDCVTSDTCSSSQDTISHPSRSTIYITSQHTQTIGLAKRFIEERWKTNQSETIGRVSGYSSCLSWDVMTMFKLTIKLRRRVVFPVLTNIPCLCVCICQRCQITIPPPLRIMTITSQWPQCSKHKLLLVRNAINTSQSRGKQSGICDAVNA